MTVLPPPGPAPVEPVALVPRVEVPQVPGRRRRTLPLLIGGGVLVALLAAAGITYAVVSAQRTPQAAASAFLDELVAGDALAAQSLLASIPATNGALLQPDTYAATTDTITGFTVLETAVDGERATVDVEFEQAGETYEQGLELVLLRKDLGLFDVWRVDAGSLPTVYVTFPRPEGMGLDVNGTGFDGFDGSYARDVPAWPGTYVFEPTGATDQYSAEPVTVTVRFDGGGSTTVATTVELTEAGIAAATAAVTARLDGCLAQPVVRPEPNCGFGVVQDDATYTNIRWTLLARPGVTFGSYTDEGWAVVPSSAGSMRFDADYSAGSETGTAESLIEGFEQGGFILGFDESGAAEFESWVYQ